MISKEEYARLYCNDHFAQMGEYILEEHKVMKQLMIDPVKTIQDLDDYGLGEAMRHSGISSAQIIDIHSGDKFELMKDRAEKYNKPVNERTGGRPTPTPIIDKLLEGNYGEEGNY